MSEFNDYAEKLAKARENLQNALKKKGEEVIEAISKWNARSITLGNWKIKKTPDGIYMKYKDHYVVSCYDDSFVSTDTLIEAAKDFRKNFIKAFKDFCESRSKELEKLNREIEELTVTP